MNNNKAWCIFNELWGFQGFFSPFLLYGVDSVYVPTDSHTNIKIIIYLSKDEQQMQIKIIDIYVNIQG